jgi:CRP-like cAMP-binding protein
VYIVEGFCHLKHEKKTIRLYSESDFFITGEGFDDTWTLTSEFTTQVSFLKRRHLSALLQDSALIEKWTQLLCLENKINVSLCSFYLQEDVTADFQYRHYSTGEIIIAEGDTSQEIFEMISGSAIVLHNNQEIGKINAGEPFGEISFLTASPRTATVKALENCFVRIADNEQFLRLIKTNPQLVVHISKTLAERVIQLNRRIIEKNI